MSMNSLGVTEWIQIVLGLYLIGHGCIHLIFLFYFKDEKTGTHTGWSGQSWLFNKFLTIQSTKYLGFMIWITIAFLFTLSGLGVLDLIVLNEYLVALMVSVSVLAIIGYVIFFDGLSPTPYHWILGVVIDLIIIIFVIFASTEMVFMLALLLLVWIYGMLFHSQVLKILGKNSSTIL